MVRDQLAVSTRGITNPSVLAAMGKVPRHEFVPEHLHDDAYGDMALPIGEGQTISQPFIVAYMTQRLDPQSSDNVLEVGGGCGYQAAILGEMAKTVCSLEIIESLAKRAAATLEELGHCNVSMIHADAHLGWSESAPYDVILVACAAPAIPTVLVEQLTENGRLIMPVGPHAHQELKLLRKQNGRVEVIDMLPVRFVPMTGGNPKSAVSD